MKKNFLGLSLSLLIFSCLVLFSSSLSGQEVKFGYVAADQVILLMPEAQTVDSLVRKYKEDSVDAILPYVLSEYQRKDSTLKVEKNKIIKDQIGKEVEQLKFQLDNWGSITQSQLQRKQNELLAPLYKKLSDAISDVAKSENYVYIFRAESLLHAPEDDNVSFKVIKKLGIDLPPSANPK